MAVFWFLSLENTAKPKLFSVSIFFKKPNSLGKKWLLLKISMD